MPPAGAGQGGEVGLQDDREDRRADRAADALQDVQLRRRVVDLVRAQDGVRGGHGGHHRHADAEASHDHRGADHHERGRGADQHERDRGHDGDHAADQRRQAAAEALGRRVRRGTWRTRRRCPGSEQQAGGDGVLVADELEVQRHQHHRAEQRGAERRTSSPTPRRTPCWRTGGRRAGGARCAARGPRRRRSGRGRPSSGTRTAGAVERAGACRSRPGRRSRPTRPLATRPRPIASSLPAWRGCRRGGGGAARQRRRRCRSGC